MQVQHEKKFEKNTVFHYDFHQFLLFKDFLWE